MSITNETEKKITVCYFGIYRPNFSRSKIYIDGLRQNNVVVLECYDYSPGLKKFIKLFVKHWQIRMKYDVMIVGHAGQITVFFAKLITRKPVIFDALCSLYEVNIISRSLFPRHSLRGMFIWLADWFAYFFSDRILVESNEQKKFFIKKFKVNPGKCTVLYTGADDSIFYPDEEIKKNQKFTVLFRGRLMPEAGVKYVIQTAEIIAASNSDIDFLVIGHGMMKEEIGRQIKKLNLENITLITEELEANDLRKRMLQCHVSLGQFENHERLSRTIPHKAFESLAMRLPYITGNTLPINEILTDKKNCLMIGLSNSEELALAIITLKNDNSMKQSIAANGYKLYQEKFSPKVLGKELKSIINSQIETYAKN